MDGDHDGEEMSVQVHVVDEIQRHILSFLPSSHRRLCEVELLTATNFRSL